MSLDRMVFTFPSTHLAMAAEDVLREQGVALEVIPTPPGHGSVCGLSIALGPREAERAVLALRERSIEWSELFPHRPSRAVH
jgi:hypothetical protein